VDKLAKEQEMETAKMRQPTASVKGPPIATATALNAKIKAMENTENDQAYTCGPGSLASWPQALQFAAARGSHLVRFHNID
jgi:hypothetical protein